jgi:hypothetical protein
MHGPIIFLWKVYIASLSNLSCCFQREGSSLEIALVLADNSHNYLKQIKLL